MRGVHRLFPIFCLVLLGGGAGCTTHPLCDYDEDGLCPPRDCDDYRADILDDCHGWHGETTNTPKGDYDPTPTPDPGTPFPEPGTSTPDAGTPFPEPGTPTPDSGTPFPEPGTPTPDSGTPFPEPGTSTPDTVTPAPTPCPLYYVDIDGDGYGLDESEIRSCEPPSEIYASLGGDCDDLNPDVHPGAVEDCSDGIDNNCNGYIDGNSSDNSRKKGGNMNLTDGFFWKGTQTLLLAGALIVGSGAKECPGPQDEDGDGWTVEAGDCDDANPAVYPGAPELCDKIDNNCDGEVDNAPECMTTYCWSNDMCEPTEFCYFDSCAAETGVCRDRPEACDDVYAPVCGCDGQTYSNACFAAASGMSVNYEGECLPVQCRQNTDCARNEYCFFKEGCAASSSQPGYCEERPGACPDLWDPVCGCDGTTYSNACDAAAAGVNVEYEGECKIEPQSCGGIAGFKCDEGYVCIYPEGTCDVMDNMGTCVEIPGACTAEYAPVCGCDGRTYSNECMATAAGMSINYAGECKPEPTACRDNSGCAKTDYCAKDSCDAASGLCEARPELCPDVWKPVCGCDGRTYSNSCEAALNGAVVDYDGECVVVDERCTDNKMCGPDAYCFFKACTDTTGICQASPEACPMVWDPVCGCDGLTYSNDCEAAMMGVSVAYAGQCRSDTTQ